MEPTLLVALLIGLSSSLHCIGMCGAISGALSMSLPPEIRQRRSRMLVFNLLFSLGRVVSYAIAGALVGSLGAALAQHLEPVAGVNLLRLIPALMVILVGLYVGGWFPGLSLIEKAGAPIWNRLEPIGRSLLPVRTARQALLYGMIWGWLPCGLVYWALFISIAAANATESALFMLVFGLATVPAMAATGMLAVWIQQIRQLPHANRIAGLLLVVLGLLSIYYAVEIEQFLRPNQ